MGAPVIAAWVIAGTSAVATLAFVVGYKLRGAQVEDAIWYTRRGMQKLASASAYGALVEEAVEKTLEGLVERLES